MLRPRRARAGRRRHARRGVERRRVFRIGRRMTLTDRLRSALDHPTEGIVLLAGDERDDDIRGRGGSIMPAAVLVPVTDRAEPGVRSEEHTSELQSLMRISYAVFCLKKKKTLKHA